MEAIMKLVLSTAAICLLLGAPAFAQQPDDKPKQEEPKKQEDTKKQEGEKEKVKEKETVKRDGERETTKTTQRETVKTEAHRIPDDKFRSNFGHEHRFHFQRGWGQHFEYGGYAFVLSSPWPSAWSYDDYVYVDFIDGQYYLIDVVHPETRILVSVNL
jgi:hypothetical protein